MAVDIQIYRENSVTVVTLSGAVDVTTTPRIQTALLVTFTTSSLEGKRTAFRIPDSLRDDWRVHPAALTDDEDRIN